MQILQMLKQDHAEVAELLDKILATGGMKTRQRLFEKVKRELTAHAHAEQAVFYTALKQHDETSDEALEAEVEHQIVERLLEDLSGGGLDPEHWSARCKVLSELVKHHVKEEEGTIFKMARKVFDRAELQELGERFQTAKEEQLAQVA